MIHITEYKDCYEILDTYLNITKFIDKDPSLNYEINIQYMSAIYEILLKDTNNKIMDRLLIAPMHRTLLDLSHKEEFYPNLR